MKKIKSLVAILTFLVIFSVYKQVQAENYIKKQNEKYGILIAAERINYMPYVIFLFKTAILGGRNKSKEYNACFMLYEQKKIKTFTSDKDLDSYLVYCYISEKKINQFIKTSCVKKMHVKKN
ncbi:hypothetical protein [Flavobacterium sp.]|uniref:hypothetical protein n=1 Tax=Flavobacterium sp. TaxID=239 RepID=UPI00262DADA5|nr:hypothetical protein [Flavobacterium sp.]